MARGYTAVALAMALTAAQANELQELPVNGTLTISSQNIIKENGTGRLIMAGLAGQDPIQDEFSKVANPKTPPLTPQMLLKEPFANWNQVIADHARPNEKLDLFEYNLRYQANFELDRAEFNINNQIGLMRGGVQPSDPSAGNELVHNLFEEAVRQAKENPDFGKDDLKKITNAMKAAYGDQIDKTMETLRHPPKPDRSAPSAPPPAAPGGGLSV